MNRSPIHYATYFDRRYLTRGLALYRSLARHSPPFVLWILCLDDETQRTLARLRLDSVKLVPLAELERADPALLEVKPGRQPVEYYWTCGPAFLRHLLGQHSRIDFLTYLDADLFFFSDPTPIYDEFGDGSILLIEYRRTPVATRASRSKSRFNVGLLVFRRTPAGLACLERWREQCIEWCFDRVEPGRWGDQKYLDDWPTRFDTVTVLRHKGAGLAPWNVGNYRFRYELGRVLVDREPLMFYHFARLRIVTGWLYEPGLHRWGHEMQRTVKHHIYVPYLRELRAAGKLIRGVGGDAPASDSLLHGRSEQVSPLAMMWHRTFLIVTDSHAL